MEGHTPYDATAAVEVLIVLMARKVAPFVYVVLGLLASLLFGEGVGGTVWVVGAIAVGALYALTRGKRSPNPERARERELKRGR